MIVSSAAILQTVVIGALLSVAPRLGAAVCGAVYIIAGYRRGRKWRGNGGIHQRGGLPERRFASRSFPFAGCIMFLDGLLR